MTLRWAALLYAQTNGRTGPARTADGRSLTADGRSLTADGRSLTADGRSLTADGRSLTADGRSRLTGTSTRPSSRFRHTNSTNGSFGRPLPLAGTAERRIAAKIGINF